MNHVFSTIDCPHCGETDLYKGKTEISLNSAVGLIFNIECPECKTILRINGFLPGGLRHDPEARTQINPQNVQQVVEKIKKFRGNLVDLFNE